MSRKSLLRVLLERMRVEEPLCYEMGEGFDGLARENRAR